jgi:very-short-patch-repair endonuclease
MPTYTEAELAAIVARMGVRQSPDVLAAVQSDAPPPTTRQKGAGRAARDAGEPAADSPLEVLFLDALKAHGLDLLPVVSQYEFAAPMRKFRFDYAWPLRLVALECDGGQHAPGGGRHNTDEDRFKLNLAAALGWRVLRFSGAQLRTEPAACIALLRRALERG